MKCLIEISILASCLFLVHGTEMKKLSMPELLQTMKYLSRLPNIPGNYRKITVDDFLKPPPKKEEKPKHSPECLILSISDTLKEHISSKNVNAITVLFQHSLETCPGLKSTIEIFQKMTNILEMDFNQTFEFIQKFNKLPSPSAAVPSFENTNRENEFQDVEKEESDKKPQDNISTPESEPSKHEKEMKYLCSLLGDCKKEKEAEIPDSEESNGVGIQLPLREPPHYHHRHFEVDRDFWISKETIERMIEAGKHPLNIF